MLHVRVGILKCAFSFSLFVWMVWASRVRAYPLEPTYPPDGQAEILPPLRSYPPRLEGETLPPYPPSQILPPTLRERESPGTPNRLIMVAGTEIESNKILKRKQQTAKTPKK